MARNFPGRARTKDPAREARAAWDRAIDVWEDFQEQGKDVSRDLVHMPALLRAIGPLKGRTVLDVGCGQGRFTRVLARRGARVTAIDWSRRMIETALRHEQEEPLQIRYLHVDARTMGARLAPRSFDLVVGCMSLMDAPGLERILTGARRLLRPGGRLVFSVSHPLNTAALGWEHPGARDRGAMRIGPYFDERVGVTRWRMKRLTRPFDTIYWHRTFESWFGILHRAGFEVVALSEPRATARQAREVPLLRTTRLFPFFLVFDCRVRSPRTARTGARSA